MRDLLKATFKSGIGSVVTLFLGVISAKIMAIVLGPAGIGLYSNFVQVQQTATTLATLGGTNAMVQGLASREGPARTRYMQTVFRLSLAALGIVAVLLALTAGPLAWAMTGGVVSGLFVAALALPLAAAVALTFVQGVLSGHRAVGHLVGVSICGSALTLTLAYPVARMAAHGWHPAFLLLLGLPSAGAALLGTTWAARAGWLAPLAGAHREPFAWEDARQYFTLGGATLGVTLAAVGTPLALRIFLVRIDGLSAVGLFSVVWTISSTYVSILLSSFSSYYLPTMSRATHEEGQELLGQVCRVTLLLSVPAIVTLVVTKALLLRLLYSTAFVPAVGLLRWMLVGDYFRISTWVLGMPILARSRPRALFWPELLRNAAFLGLSALALEHGLAIDALGAAFTMGYAGHLVFCVLYDRGALGLAVPIRVVVLWLGGLALVVGASLANWSALEVHPASAALWVSGALGFSALSVTRDERQAAWAWGKGLLSR